MFTIAGPESLVTRTRGLHDGPATLWAVREART